LQINEIFQNIYKIDGKLATKNLVIGKKVYNEELIKIDDIEYRTWNPYRSKLAAAILNKLRNVEIKSKSSVLYLGAATGTTASHVSDIVGENGEVYCIEISERNMRELIKVCNMRSNMLPIMSDAREIGKYKEEIKSVDIIYQDISSRDQADILLANSTMLREGGTAYVAIKSQSISISKKPEVIYEEFLDRVSGSFELIEKVDIMPYDKLHLFVVLRKK
jgi:fibrillarin-like pre-rRNA processing protein